MKKAIERRPFVDPPPAHPVYDLISRAENDLEYYACLGWFCAREMCVAARKGHDSDRVARAIRQYRKRHRRSRAEETRRRDAILLALDPGGTLDVNPSDWTYFRGTDCWLFLEMDRMDAGFVSVADMQRVQILDEAIPNPVRLGPLPGDRAKEADDHVPPLSSDQFEILKIMMEPDHYSRKKLALLMDPDGDGVNEERVRDAMNDEEGLKALGLVKHSRKTGYRLTAEGKKIASLL